MLQRRVGRVREQGEGTGSPDRRRVLRGLIAATGVLAVLIAGGLGGALAGGGTAAASTTLISWSTAAPIDAGSNNAFGVSCATTSVCVATDMEHTIWTTTNASSASPTWASGSIDSGADLNAVSCVPGGALCVAIDPTGNVFETTNPAGGAGTWVSGGNIGGTSNAAAISCPSTSLCTIVDQSGNVYTSTNPAGGHTQWTGPDGINSGTWIADVVCPSASLCVASTINDKILTSTTPTNHSTSSWAGTSISGNPLFPVACTPSASVCIAGDGGGDVYTSANPVGGGSTWSTGTGLSGGGGALISAAGCGSGSSGDICLFGDANGNVYESTNPSGGVSTYSDANPIDSGIKIWSISCPSSTFCVLGDNAGNIFYGSAGGTTTGPTGTTTGPTGTTTGPTGTTAKPLIPTSTAVECDYFVASQNDTCTATVGNGDGSISSTATGTVSFSGDQSGACPLQPTSGSPGVASCSITVPGSESTFLNITASYPGDSTHSASSGNTAFLTAGPGSGLYGTTIQQFNPPTLQITEDNPVSGSSLTGLGQFSEQGTSCSSTSDPGASASAAGARAASVKVPTLTVRDTVRHARKGPVKLRLSVSKKQLRRLFPGTHTITLELQITVTPPHGAAHTLIEFESFVLHAPKHGKVRVSRLQSFAGPIGGAKAARVELPLRTVGRAHDAASDSTTYTETANLAQACPSVTGTLTLTVIVPGPSDPNRGADTTASLSGTFFYSQCGELSHPSTDPTTVSANGNGAKSVQIPFNGAIVSGAGGLVSDSYGTSIGYVVNSLGGVIGGSLGTNNSGCKTVPLFNTGLTGSS